MICTPSLLFDQSSIVLDYRGSAATARYSVHYVIVDVYIDVVHSKTPFNNLIGDYIMFRLVSIIAFITETGRNDQVRNVHVQRISLGLINCLTTHGNYQHDGSACKEYYIVEKTFCIV